MKSKQDNLITAIVLKKSGRHNPQTLVVKGMAGIIDNKSRDFDKFHTG
jgi:hypothetical protein